MRAGSEYWNQIERERKKFDIFCSVQRSTRLLIINPRSCFSLFFNYFVPQLDSFVCVHIVSGQFPLVAFQLSWIRSLNAFRYASSATLAFLHTALFCLALNCLTPIVISMDQTFSGAFLLLFCTAGSREFNKIATVVQLGVPSFRFFIFLFSSNSFVIFLRGLFCYRFSNKSRNLFLPV